MADRPLDDELAAVFDRLLSESDQETLASVATALRPLVLALEERSVGQRNEPVEALIRRRTEGADVERILEQAAAIDAETARLAEENVKRWERTAETVGRIARALVVRGALGV